MSKLDPLPPIRHFESNSSYTIVFGGGSLENFPLDECGFPIWNGILTKWGITHAAGAYQFEPATWHYYAIPLGIKDFSVQSQNAVATVCFKQLAFAPWAPYDSRLAEYITSLGGPKAFALGGSNPHGW